MNAAAPATMVSRTTFLGNFDGVFGRVAMGWACFPHRPTERPTIQILVGERVVAEGVADKFRDDLLKAGIGDAKYAFKILLPVELFDGRQHQLYARFANTSATLNGGPHGINQRLATLHDAFAAAPSEVRNPLSDHQVAVLQGLTRVCETLAEQNKVLRLLVDAQPVQSQTAQRIEDVHAETDKTPDRPSGALAAHPNFGALAEDFLRHAAPQGDVVIFSIIDWDFRIQRPQHIASQLGKVGHRVTYVSVHLEPSQPLGPRFFVRSKPARNVYEVVLRCQQPVPSVYAGFEDPETVRELCVAFEDATAALGIVAPLAIVHYPTWLPVVNSIPGACIVFDCMDHLAGFSTASPQVIDLEKELVSSADLVVTTSEYLSTAVGETRANAIVRNGAEVEFFATPPGGKRALGRGPIIGYYGAIAEWFDVELIRSVARKRPDWTFILIGSTDGADISGLAELENVKLLGEIPYNNLPEYLYSFDCCTIPFKINELTKATNPVKLYEYFAAGKPVVATDMPELRLVPSNLLSIAKSTASFIKGIERALREPLELASQRQAWALQNSWTGRARAIQHYVKEATPLVSVVVLTYNGLELTKACLYGLECNSLYENIEIIIVDNASTDGTVEFLRGWAAERPKVRLVLNEHNRGFAGGNNDGIKAAGGDYIILLNNDTFVTPGWVRDLIRPAIADERIGLVGPLTNMIGNEQKIAIHYKDMEEMRREARRFTLPRRGRLHETNNLAFFCVCIPRRVINRVGLLDEEFGLGFFEDDDYCMRVADAGYRLVVADGVFVHHHLSGSFDRDPEQKRSLMTTNKGRFESKWGPWKPHQYRDEPGFGG